MKITRKNCHFRSYSPLTGVLMAVAMFSGCALTPEAKEARFIGLGQKEMAKKDYLRAVIQFENAVRVKKADPEAYYQLALAHFGMGDYRTGIPFLSKALALNSNYQPAQIKMAELMASSTKYLPQAEIEARKVLKVNPNNTDALNALAVSEWKLGEHRNAEMDLLRALRQAPADIRLSLNLALIKFNQNDIAGAEQIIKTVMNANPKSADPVVALGGLYMLTGKVGDAEQQYRRALSIDSGNELALLNLAKLYESTNRPELSEPVYKKLSTLADPKYRAIHAMLLFQSGKRDQAVSEFEGLASRDPSDRAARTRLIEAYFAVGRLSDAENLLTTALKKNGKDVDALLQRSRIHLRTANYNQAQKDASEVLRFQPDSARAHYVMSRVYQGLGSVLTQRQELAEALRLNRFLLPARLEYAQLLLTNNAARAAFDVLDGAPEDQKHLAPLLIERNWVLWALGGDLSELRKGIDEGLRLGRMPDFLIQDAMYKLQKGQIQESRAALEEALKINPGDLRALSMLNKTYGSQKESSVAVQKVKEYAVKQPNSAPVQQFLGSLLAANGQPAEARAALTAATTTDPKFLPALLTLAQLDATENKWDHAEETLKKVLRVNSGNVTARHWLGDIQILKGNRQQALDYYRQVVEADGTNASALNNVAYLMTENGRQDEALKYAEKARELAPGNPDYADTLGWLLYNKGLYDVAIKHLERATSHNENAVWKYHLAMAYAKAGEKKQAVVTFEAALKRDPNAPEAKMTRDVLAAAR